MVENPLAEGEGGGLISGSITLTCKVNVVTLDERTDLIKLVRRVVHL